MVSVPYFAKTSILPVVGRVAVENLRREMRLPHFFGAMGVVDR